MSETTQVTAGLTLEEKALLLEGVDSWSTHGVPRLGVRPLYLTDGPHGVRKVREASGGFGVSDNVPSTAFPTSASVASSWDPEHARRMGAAIGRECVALGVDVLLAPGVNIKRSPLCGRNFEYFSEDPLVSGVFGSAFVDGVQSQGVGTSVKHYAANSNEDYRFVGDSLVDERALREIYLRAFERVVKEARPATVMCAYNRVNGTFAAEHRELLTGVLRDEWGFDGLVMTDWGATHDRVAGLVAGCDLDMPGQVRHNRRRIVDAVSNGSLDVGVLDRAVERVLALGERCTPPSDPTPYDPATHARLAAEIATDGAVLLSNDGTLPLGPGSGRLLVVGEMFERMRFQGAGSSLINPTSVVTPQDAFAARDVAHTYERGYRSLDATADATLEAPALAAAHAADTVLFFGGLTDLEESEGFDRTTMALPGNQRHLLEALLDQGARVVLVLYAGAPVELPFLDRLAAVLDMYLPGMQGGEATAALLLGEANPSGKLTESWPRTAADSSAAADYDRGRTARYYESIYVGYRYYDAAGTRLQFPFGHGLSYTTFAYRDLAVRQEDGRVVVTALVENTGDRDGAEVVQLYVRNAPSAVFKVDKELRAFTKVVVPAGESRRVTLGLDVTDLAYWDVAEGGWVLESGDYEVVLAASATDERLAATLPVDGRPTSRSPYPAEVDRAYATPPTTVPRCFGLLLGRPAEPEPTPRRLTTETRLGDARGTLVGRLMHAAVLATMRRQYRRALAMPDSLERDTRVKNTHFLVRMMPFNSLRSMAMSSSGAFPYEVALAIEQLAAGRLVRAARLLAGRTAREDRTA